MIHAKSRRDVSRIPITTSSNSGSTNANSTMACAFGLPGGLLGLDRKMFISASIIVSGFHDKASFAFTGKHRRIYECNQGSIWRSS